MKKIQLILALLLLQSTFLFSQVAINADGSAPDASAGLDISYSNKGLLIPRMSFEKRNLIQNPAEGLIIYCTNCNPDGKGVLSIYEGDSWKILDLRCNEPKSPVAGEHVSTTSQITWNWDALPTALGYVISDENDFDDGIELANITTYTDYNLVCNTSYIRYIWAYNECGHSAPLIVEKNTEQIPITDNPMEGTLSSTLTTITWDWNTVEGATGYKWGTVSDINSAIDLGTATTTTESNLVCGKEYIRYVWGYNACGYSPVTTLIYSTLNQAAESPAAAEHKPDSYSIDWSWHPVNEASGYKWNTTNNYATASNVGLDTVYIETNLPCFTPFTRYIWAYNNCGVSVAVELNSSTTSDFHPAPSPAINFPSSHEITWNWHPPASHYSEFKWNTTNNFNTAFDLHTDTTYTESGLSCNTSFTRYVWGYDNCAVSTPILLNATTALFPPANPPEAVHVALATEIQWKWNKVQNATGYKWNTVNNLANAQDVGMDTTFTESSLVCNTNYSRFIWAYSNCGTSSATTIHQITALNPPPAPTATTHQSFPTFIVWNWSPVAGATGYKWGISNNYNESQDMGANTSRLEAGLTCNTNYTRYVWAYSACGVSDAAALVQNTAVDPPQSPSAGTHVPGSFQVEWKWFGVSGATGYKWNTSNNYGTATDMGLSTSKIETGLDCNTSYTRYVWSYGTCGQSAAVDLIQTTSLHSPAPPTAGTHTPSPNGVIWAWNPVDGAEGYKWNTTNNESTAIVVGSGTTYTESNLLCNTPYLRYVWAFSHCGTSTPVTLNQTTSLDPPAAPQAAVHTATASQIVWNWNPVINATGYRWNTTNNLGTSQDLFGSTTKTETGLNCNTTYGRYVWAYSNCGTSIPVSLSQSTTIETPAIPAAGTHVASNTQVIWNWNTVAGATGYKWNTVDDYASATNVNTATTYTENSLVCGTSYTRYIWAYNACAVSFSRALTKTTTTTPPAAPVAGTHVATSTQITWNWSSVPTASSYKWNTENNIATATDIGNVTSKTETGLNCLSAYTRYVWAFNGCSSSAATTLSKTTLQDPPAAPTAGTNITGPNEIVWTWNTVANATGYKWNTVDNPGTAQDVGVNTTYTESGLACNTNYTRYVWAYSSCGTSASTPLNQLTSVFPPPAPIPGTHQSFPTIIVWNWNPVTGATGYKWGLTSNYNEAQEMGTSTSRLEMGLTCNSNYTRYVWAYGTCGVSDATMLVQTSAVDPPQSPNAGTHVPGSFQIEWKWFGVTGATGYKWNTTNNYGSATDMGLATSKIETELACNSNYTRYIWSYGPCGQSAAVSLVQTTSLYPPASPTAGTNIPSPNDITWAWNTVEDAEGYKWNNTNNESLAEDVGQETTFTEAGLLCNTNYHSYVWAYNHCGTSTPVTLNQITALDPPDAPVAATHTATASQIVWNWNPVSDATGYKWNTTDNLSTAQDLSVNTTKTETGLYCNTSYDRYVWAYSNCGTSASVKLTYATIIETPPAPAAGTHVASNTQVIWNWNAVAGATGYKWNTVDDYATAFNVNNATSYTENSLVCGTSYNRYVWAYNNCAVSSPCALTKTTTTVPPAAPVAGTHVAYSTQVTWNWSSVPTAVSYKWNTENNVATATDIGNVTSKTETGLNCSSSYTRYVWASNGCSNSEPATLTQTTLQVPPAVPTAGTHNAGPGHIVWNWNAVPDAAGYKWYTSNDYNNAADMGTALTKMETGLSCLTNYTRFVWAYNSCGVSTPVTLSQSTTNDPPAAPTAATQIPSETQIIWNWNTVAGASGYKWNTVNNYTTATDMYTATSKTETGLACGSNFTRYVWAYSACGYSVTPVSLTQSTTACWQCGTSIVVYHIADTVAPVTKTVTYGTVTNVPGETSKCWITRNLGADQQPTAVNDATEASAGWYWQFNRKQGYKHDGTVRTPSTTWIVSISDYSNWSTANDPCAYEIGTGWRVPTSTEWTNVDAGGPWTNWNHPYGSLLKMHASGRLYYNSGNLSERGQKGSYWSSTQYGIVEWAQMLSFTSSTSVLSQYEKAYGYPIRCIKN